MWCFVRITEDYGKPVEWVKGFEDKQFQRESRPSDDAIRMVSD